MGRRGRGGRGEERVDEDDADADAFEILATQSTSIGCFLYL